MQDLQRIEKIFRMLGSTHDGEIINAVNSIRKILIAQDKNFSDLANHLFSSSSYSPSSSYDDQFKREYYSQQRRKTKNRDVYLKMCDYLINMPAVMTTWESTFIVDINEQLKLNLHQLSVKQDQWLNKIYKRYTEQTETKGA